MCDVEAFFIYEAFTHTFRPTQLVPNSDVKDNTDNTECKLDTWKQTEETLCYEEGKFPCAS